MKKGDENDWRARHEVRLHRYNYDSKQNEDLDTVSMFVLAQSLDEPGMAMLLYDWLNNCARGRAGRALGEMFADGRAHRSLQADIVKFAFDMLFALAQVDMRWTDGRNEGAIKMAKALYEKALAGELGESLKWMAETYQTRRD